MDKFDNFFSFSRYAINLSVVRYIVFDDDGEHVTFYFEKEHKQTFKDAKLYNYLKQRISKVVE